MACGRDPFPWRPKCVASKRLRLRVEPALGRNLVQCSLS